MNFMTYSLIPYPDYFDLHLSFMEEFENKSSGTLLREYASQLLQLGLHDEIELEEALQKAVRALVAARISSASHIKKVFISSGGEIKRDWLVSELGMRLIVLNADVSNPQVARLQVRILSQTGSKF